MSVSPSIGQFCPSAQNAGQLPTAAPFPGNQMRASTSYPSPKVKPPAGTWDGSVSTSAPLEGDARVRIRSPPETDTFAGLVVTLFMTPPPNQLGAQADPSELPLNSSSNTSGRFPPGAQDGCGAAADGGDQRSLA